MKRGSLCPVSIATGQCVASQRCSGVCQTHKNESKCASKFICALTVYCASETTVRLLDGLEQVENYEGRDCECEEWVLPIKAIEKKHFDTRPLKLYILKLNWSFGGLGDSLDNCKNGFFQFGHPHIINVNGRVLFCRDCWEEDGVCRGWDFGEAGVVTVQCKGKQSSALVYSRVPRVGWEADGCSFSHISVEENSF